MPIPAQASEIRKPLTSTDWEEIRKLCCLTGNAGEPIERSRWPFFGEFWVTPYRRLRPEWSYLARVDSAPAGYLTGCPDTSTFETQKFTRFLLPLSVRILLRRYPQNGDTRRFLRRLFRLEKGPERLFSPALTERLRSEYPAHLHMNVAEAHRGAGLGKLLIDRYAAELRRTGVPGIHLYCGEKPVRFYARNGFTELERIEFKPGTIVFALGLKL